MPMTTMINDLAAGVVTAVNWVYSGIKSWAVVPKYRFGVEIEIIGVPRKTWSKIKLRFGGDASRERRLEAFRERVAEALTEGGESTYARSIQSPVHYDEKWWNITTDGSLKVESKKEGT